MKQLGAEAGGQRSLPSWASRLASISAVAALALFAAPGAKADVPDAPSLTHVSEFLATPDGLTLVAGFVKIRSAKLRRSIVELVSYLAQNQDK